MGIRPSCTHWTLSGVTVVFICIWYVSKHTKGQKRVQVYRFHRAKWAVCPVSSSCGRLQRGDWFCLWLCWWNGVSDSPLFIEGWVSHGSICTAWLVNAAQIFSSLVTHLVPTRAMAQWLRDLLLLQREDLASVPSTHMASSSQDSVPSSGLCESYI